MRIASKQDMSLTKAKSMIKAIKALGGKIKRIDSQCASVKDSRGYSMTLCFKSNLELRGLI